MIIFHVKNNTYNFSGPVKVLHGVKYTMQKDFMSEIFHSGISFIHIEVPDCNIRVEYRYTYP